MATDTKLDNLIFNDLTREGAEIPPKEPNQFYLDEDKSLEKVVHDNTMTGDGTADRPLSVVSGGGGSDLAVGMIPLSMGTTSWVKIATLDLNEVDLGAYFLALCEAQNNFTDIITVKIRANASGDKTIAVGRMATDTNSSNTGADKKIGYRVQDNIVTICIYGRSSTDAESVMCIYPKNIFALGDGTIGNVSFTSNAVMVYSDTTLNARYVQANPVSITNNSFASNAGFFVATNNAYMPTDGTVRFCQFGNSTVSGASLITAIAISAQNGKIYYYNGTPANCTREAWVELGGGSSGSSISKGNYCTTYGIITLPSNITTNATTNVLNLPAGIVMKTSAGRVTSSSAFTHTVTSTSNFTLFYAGGQWLECGIVEYSETEPSDNGQENYMAWWNGTVWKFKSNDSGNVWREVESATPVCDCFFTGTNLTRIETVGYVWGNGITKGQLDAKATKITDFMTPLTSINKGATKTEIDSIDSQIDDINNSISTINTNIDSLNTSVDSLNTSVDSLNTSVGSINTNIDSLYEELGEKLDTTVAASTYATNTDAVHKTGDELIGGVKTITDKLTIQVPISYNQSTKNTLDFKLPNGTTVGYVKAQRSLEDYHQIVLCLPDQEESGIGITDSIDGPVGFAPTPVSWSNTTEIVTAEWCHGHGILVESQMPTSSNGYTWYRKYSDGWVEQGALLSGGNNTTSELDFNFPITMTTGFQYQVAAYANNAGWDNAIYVRWIGNTKLGVKLLNQDTSHTLWDKVSFLVYGKAA